MDIDAAMAYALAKPGAWADDPFGHGYPLAKVANKIFLFPGSVDERPAISVKNTAEAVTELTQRLAPDAGPAPYLDKRLWARVLIDRLADADVEELIDESYDLVVDGLPRARRPS